MWKNGIVFIMICGLWLSVTGCKKTDDDLLNRPNWLTKEQIKKIEKENGAKIRGIYEFIWEGKTYYQFYSFISLKYYRAYYDEAGHKTELGQDEGHEFHQAIGRRSCLIWEFGKFVEKPQWLLKRIEEIKKDPKGEWTFEIYRIHWRREMFYYVHNLYDSCLSCEIYNKKGKRFLNNLTEEDKNDFIQTLEQEKTLIWKGKEH